MNQDIFEGKWSQFKGEAKSWWGELTDDDIDRTEGNLEAFTGLLQEKYGYTRQFATEEIDRHMKEFEGQTHEEPVSSPWQIAKEENYGEMREDVESMQGAPESSSPDFAKVENDGQMREKEGRPEEPVSSPWQIAKQKAKEENYGEMQEDVVSMQGKPEVYPRDFTKEQNDGHMKENEDRPEEEPASFPRR
jgi:uncharacterized protein YjbJ (UPF0337 family)